MSDFKKVIISNLEDAIQSHKDKVQAGAVDAKTPAPFATFDVPEETPIRTLSGIAGYETTFEVEVYHSRYAGANELKHQVLDALEGLRTEGKTLRFKSCQTDYYPDYDLHGVRLTFRIV